METICEKLIKYRLDNSNQKEKFMHVASFLINGKKRYEKVC